MRLINKDGVEMKRGAKLTSFRGETYYLRSSEEPRHAGSGGRVYAVRDEADVTRADGGLRATPYFLSVFDLHWEV